MSPCANCQHAYPLPNAPGRIACVHPDALNRAGARDAWVSAALTMGVTADAESVRSGRFRWPRNFDPDSTLSCRGAEPEVRDV